MNIVAKASRMLVLSAALAALSSSIGSTPASAQTSASVSVNASTTLAPIQAQSFGLNTAVWDGNLLDAAVPKLLTGAGIGALRFPGGSTSDVYNWQSNSIVTGQSGFANSANTFDAFMGLVKSIGGMPVVTVNYGSNTSGNGGGTPSFAASWVQYANVTKGYGVKYWEIGNEVYGNGEYGSSWETDLHSAHDPTTYGQNVAAFASAMKAVDPTIKVGAVLTAPGNWPDGQSPDWNSSVLAQCGTAIDFVIVHWYPQNPGNESDANLLGAPESGTSGSPGIASMVSSLKSLIAKFAGSNAPNVQILVTETNSVSSNPGKQTLSIVNAMFVADDVLTWLENGVANVDVWDLHNGSTGGNTASSLFGSATFGDYGVLSNGSSGEPAADTPFPSYYGLEMVSLLGKPGDTLVSASSSSKLLAAHAVEQGNGNLALLLINKDPSNATTVNVSLSGFTPAASGTAYSYGASSSGIGSQTIGGLGASFAVSVPAYSLMTIVMAPGGAPDFSLVASPANLSVTQGASSTSTVTVTPSGGFTGSVSLAASGMPNGVTASFSPSTTTGTSTLTLSAASSAATGSTAVTITGTSGSLSHQTSLTLTVNAAVPPSFTLAASPSSVALTQGGSAAITISVAGSGGFSGPVALSASGLPPGVSGSFNPASTTATTTLTLSAAATAATGSGGVTVTGTSGSLSQSLSIPVTVSAVAGGGGGTASSGGGPATFTGKAASNSPWFDEDDVVLSTPAPITALTLTITVPAGNVTFSSLYNTVGSPVAQSEAGGTNLIYTFTLKSGQTIGAGSFTFAAQMSGNGTAHAASGDTWSVTYTAGGVSYTQSGAI